MFVISLNLAHKLLPCASTEETRYYLNGIGVHLLPQGARLVATDGLIMGIFRDHEAHGTFDGIAVVSRLAIVDAFKAARKEARHDDPAHYWLVVADNGMAHVVLAPTALCAMSGRDDDKECPTLWRSVKSVLIDGSFPDYTRVIPSRAFDVTPSRYGWDPALIGRFADVLGNGTKKSACSGNGTKKSACSISLVSGSADGNSPWFVLSAAVPDFVGIAMPMRNGTDNSATLVAAARDVLDLGAAKLSFVPQPEAAKADA